MLKIQYQGAYKSLARPGRKQDTGTKLLTSASQSKKINKFLRPTRFLRHQWPPRRTKNGELSIVFFSRVRLRTYQHTCIYTNLLKNSCTTYSFDAHICLGHKQQRSSDDCSCVAEDICSASCDISAVSGELYTCIIPQLIKVSIQRVCSWSSRLASKYFEISTRS